MLYTILEYNFIHFPVELLISEVIFLPESVNLT